MDSQEQKSAMMKARSAAPAPQSQPIRDDLVVRCQELLEWNRTGLLAGGKGGAVRALADRLSGIIGKNYALSVAESQTKDDAMRFVVSHATLKARVEELENLLRDINAIDAHGYRVAPMNYNLQLRIRAALSTGEAGDIGTKERPMGIDIAKAAGLKTCLDDHALLIIRELYKAVSGLGNANPCLLAMIGSWGDTLDDTDILDGLRRYNEMGECFIPDVAVRP